MIPEILTWHSLSNGTDVIVVIKGVSVTNTFWLKVFDHKEHYQQASKQFLLKSFKQRKYI